MNTKSIIGIIIVVAIIALIVVWLWKTPTSPSQPVVVQPVVTQSSDTATSEVVAPTMTATSSANPTSPTATAGPRIISTTTRGGMTIEVTKEGSGPQIVNGETASMLYTGKLADGTVFDSTASRGNTPFEFTLGAGQVIKGWDEGIVGMRVGEQRTLIIPADLAYGANGYPPVIPANATLTFDVTLVGINK